MKIITYHVGTPLCYTREHGPILFEPIWVNDTAHRSALHFMFSANGLCEFGYSL